MAFGDDVPVPQGLSFQRRVNNEISDQTGHIEDQNLDLDARTLAILGKRQQLSRNFGLVSLVAFSTTLLASWESIACTFQNGLVNGGPATLVYGLSVSWLGSLAVCASLAEMASMAPTSGGQYHWVSQLAPARVAVGFSWAAGWISIFARLSVCASIAFVVAQLIQGLLIFNISSYEPLEWHATMLYWMVLLIAMSVNILGIKIFPHIESAAFIIHICFFFALLVPLIYLTPQTTARYVFSGFENAGGWENNGISWCIGLLTTAWSFVGIDGTTHMSEEVKDSANVVPKSMVIAVIISGVLTVAFSLAILFGIGDINLALQTPTNFPIIHIFHTATGSKGATTAITCTLVTTLAFATFGELASASRLAWAFARDKGFPFPTYFAHVSRYYRIPVRSIVLITFVACLLGLVNVGSSTAFNAFTSLPLVGHYTSYLLPITLLVVRRFGRKEIPWGPWTLGRWGLAINLVAITYSVVLILFAVFPPFLPVSAGNLNYAGIIFGAAMVLCTIMWFAYGRKAYCGPIREVVEDGHVKI